MNDAGSIDWDKVWTIAKFSVWALVNVGILIWLTWRKFKLAHGDEFGFAVFRWMLSIDGLLLLIWVVVPYTFNSGPFGVIIGVAGMAFCGILMSMAITPALIGPLIGAFTGELDGSNAGSRKEPLYSMALALRNRSEPHKAIEAIAEQLEEFPHDFEGMMLMAEIEAHDLKSMPAARETLEELLEKGKFPKGRKSYILTTLADWELELARNPERARAAFLRIVNLFPDSEIARKAQQRLLRLPTSSALSDKDVTRLHTLPSQRSAADQAAIADTAGVAPEAEAGILIQRLTEHPEDDEARERLAEIYARHYKRVDMAADQLEQLISDPRQPREDTVRRLNQLARYYLNYALDGDAARVCLHRIVNMFPGASAAELAYVESQTIPSTEALRRESGAIPMVEAEKDLGLKRRPPEWS